MELPLFPLHVVLFPGRPLPLHVFEPRYRTMLEDCLAADRRFGVVAIQAGKEVGGCAEIFEVGTVAQIESVTPLADGRSDILTRGVQRFRVQELVPGTPYLKARVELLAEGCAAASDRARAAQLRDLLVPYLAGLGAPDELLGRLPSDPDELAYLAAAALQTEVPDQQRLLELDSTGTRLAATLAMLRREASLMRHFGRVGSLRPAGPNGAQLN
ncbi:MAG TPA: LON peptidase substrate-binding domain-containing protein [Egibacteraceae bacterium]|nr:LON peptidase substrate-binding domain-containing protein [Egibacteraceae bacterium]